MLTYQSEVTDLRAIEEAYVPVLKMRYSGIEIDMTFARLNMPEIPEKMDLQVRKNVHKVVLSATRLREFVPILSEFQQ